MAPKKPPTLQYICLSVLFVLVCAYQIRAMLFYFPEFFHSQAVGWPFTPEYVGGQPHAAFLNPNALDAGMKENDILGSLNSRPFTSEAVYGDVIAHAKPGDTINAVVRTPGQHDDMTLVVIRALLQ